jgi:hypothetical protein
LEKVLESQAGITTACRWFIMIDWVTVLVYFISLLASTATLYLIIWLISHRKNGRRLWLIPMAIMTVVNIAYFILVTIDTFYPPFFTNEQLNYISRFDRLFMVLTIFLVELFSFLSLRDRIKRAKSAEEVIEAEKDAGVMA